MRLSAVRLALDAASRRALIAKIVRVDHAGELGADQIYAGQMAVLGKTNVGPVIKKMWEEEKEHLDTMERLAARHDVPHTVLSPVFSAAAFGLATCCRISQEEYITKVSLLARILARSYSRKGLQPSPNLAALIHGNSVLPMAGLAVTQEMGIASLSWAGLTVPIAGVFSALIGKEGAMACTVAVEELIGQHYNDQLKELLADDPEAHKELLKTLTRLRDDELHHHDTGIKHDGLKAPMYDALKFVIQTGCKGAIFIAERI